MFNTIFPNKLFFIFVFLVLSFFGNAENKFSLESPYQTVVTHLSNLEEDHYYPSIAALTLAGNQYSIEQKAGLALKLKEIINQCDLDLEEASKKKFLLTLHLKQDYILCKDLPGIYLIRVGKEWKYSPETVSKIIPIYEDIFGSHKELFTEVKTKATKDTNETIEVITPIKNSSPDKNINTSPITNNISATSDTTEPITISSDSLKDNKYVFSMRTPYHTVKSYMYFTKPDNYHPEIAAQLVYAPLLSADEKIGMVEKFKQVAISLGLKVNIEDISRNPDYIDNEYEDHRYILSDNIKEIYLIKEDSNWYLSNSSVEFILDKHKEIFFLGTNRLDDLAKLLKSSIGTEAEFIKEESNYKKWKHLSLALIIVLLIVTYVVTTKILQLISKLIFKNKIFLPHAQRLYPPLVAFILLLSFSIVLPSLGLKLEALKFIINITNMFWVCLLLISIFRLIDLTIIILQGHKSIEKDAYKKGLAPFFGMFAKVIAITVATLYILQLVGIDLKTFLTGLSIGGLTLALAAQDSLKNFFGSVMIFLDRPFQIGDWIVSDNISGDVESIGLRSTRIRTFHNSLITVPNSKLADFTLDNMGKRRFRRFKTVIKLKYSTPAEKIDQFTKRLQQLVIEDEKIYDGKYHIYLNDYGKYSLDVMFYIYFDVPGFNDELKCRHDIMLKTISIARELKIEFADPLNSSFFDGKDIN